MISRTIAQELAAHLLLFMMLIHGYPLLILSRLLKKTKVSPIVKTEKCWISKISKQHPLSCFLFLVLHFFRRGGKDKKGRDLQAAARFQQVGIASSPSPVGSGARATGMGGAFIGIADDATAASWNPSGLIQLERPEISIVGAYLNSTDKFSSDKYPDFTTTGKLNDFNINYFSFAYPFGSFPNMIISVNYQRLYEFGRNYEYRAESSSQGENYLIDQDFEQKGYVSVLGFAYAIEVAPMFSFGASLNVWTDKLIWENGWEETSYKHSVITEEGSITTIDTHINDKYTGFSGINTNLGILWNLNQYITLGMVVKTPFKASIHNKFSQKQTRTTILPDNMTVQNPSTPNEYDEDVKLRMPLSYGCGLAWRISDAFSLGFDIYWTEWSGFVLIDSRGNRYSPIDGRPESSSRLKDITQVRLGGEYLFISQKNRIVVPLRAGIFSDPETSYNNVRRYYGATIGSGIAYKGIVFDMAYQLRWGDDVDTGNLIPASRADIKQHLFLASVIVHF